MDQEFPELSLGKPESSSHQSCPYCFEESATTESAQSENKKALEAGHA